MGNRSSNPSDAGDTLCDDATEGSSTGEIKNRAGIFGTSMNISVQIMGLGVLQLPYMLRQGGWFCLVLMVSCAFAANYTGKLVIQCCYNDAQIRVNRTYSDIGYAAFGRFGQIATKVFENSTLFGVSSLFLILAGKFLEELFVNSLVTREWILVSAAVVSLPIVVFKTIGELKIVSFIGVAAVVVTVVAVITEALQAGFSDQHAAETDMLLPTGFFSAFSAMALAYGCHAGLPDVESSMREPSKFPQSFNLAYAVVMLMYLPVAIVGYAVYGDQVYSPILCSLPRDNLVQIIAKALMTTHVLLAYPILMMLFIVQCEHTAGLNPGVPLYLGKRTLLRLAIVVASAGVAVGVPFFDDMMSLIGAVCVVMTTFILPAVFFLRIHARTAAMKIVPVIVAVVGATGGTIGAVQATMSLVSKVTSGANPNDG